MRVSQNVSTFGTEFLLSYGSGSGLGTDSIGSLVPDMNTGRLNGPTKIYLCTRRVVDSSVFGLLDPDPDPDPSIIKQK